MIYFIIGFAVLGASILSGIWYRDGKDIEDASFGGVSGACIGVIFGVGMWGLYDYNPITLVFLSVCIGIGIGVFLIINKDSL